MGKVYFLICKLDPGLSGGSGYLADHSTSRIKVFAELDSICSKSLW